MGIEDSLVMISYLFGDLQTTTIRQNAHVTKLLKLLKAVALIGLYIICPPLTLTLNHGDDLKMDWHPGALKKKALGNTTTQFI